MKWNIAIATLVATFTLCSQSYGYDLLDRMLGGSGCGCASSCCEASVSCCDTGPACGCDNVGPACGCDMTGPSCGCDNACDPCASSCGRKPLISINLPKIRPLFKRCNSGCASACDTSCGCDVVASCGCDNTPTCGCNTAPTCGCDPCSSCNSGCKPKLRLGLLDKIFASRGGCGCGGGCEATCGADACGCNSGCDGCGCASWGGSSMEGDTAPAPEAEGDSVSLPPTPIVDPSAFVAPGSVYRVSNR